ncbi:hypothetical protein [Alkalihalobacillus sp. 1P02AB]|uniref:hypothetical protein n=1 Tax=Alkalihalobacillus sp. 1P02AB TaxID=3132260 RepID=UPI0039A56DD8
MSLEPFEKKMKNLKKQYDELPSQNSADQIMERIKREEVEEEPLQRKGNPYWRWASLCAGILLFLGIGYVFTQMISDLQLSSSDSSESAEYDMAVGEEAEEMEIEIFQSESDMENRSDDSFEEPYSELVEIQSGQMHFWTEVPVAVTMSVEREYVSFQNAETNEKPFLVIEEVSDEESLSRFLNGFAVNNQLEEVEMEVPLYFSSDRQFEQMHFENGDDLIYLIVESKVDYSIVYVIIDYASTVQPIIEYSQSIIENMNWVES